MSHEDGIAATGRIVEVLENACYRAELPNGKIVMAYPGREFLLGSPGPLNTGDRVALKMTHYDFSKAEIVAPENF